MHSKFHIHSNTFFLLLLDFHHRQGHVHVHDQVGLPEVTSARLSLNDGGVRLPEVLSTP